MSKNNLENNNKGESLSTITQQKADDFGYLLNLSKEKLTFFTARKIPIANGCIKNMENKKSL